MAQQKFIAATTILAAAVVLACAAILTADYVAARRRAPRDDAKIAALQQQVRTTAALAKTLEAEQKRIAEANRVRRVRINRLAFVLIVAGGLFIGGAKWLLARRPAPLPRLPERARAASKAARKRAPLPSPAGDPDLAVVDEIVANEGTSPEAAIPILQAIQAHFRYLPDDAMRRVCELTEITPAQIAGTSSFYSRFRRAPVGDHLVRVCHGTACHVSGARQITDELRRGLEIPEGTDTDPSRTFTVEEVACLGCCSLAPVLMVDEHTVGKLTPTNALDALEAVQPRAPV